MKFSPGDVVFVSDMGDLFAREAKSKYDAAKEKSTLEDYASAKNLLELALSELDLAIVEVRDKACSQIEARINDDRSKTDDPYALLRLDEAEGLINEARSSVSLSMILSKLKDSQSKLEDAEARIEELTRRRIMIGAGVGVAAAVAVAAVLIVYRRLKLKSHSTQ